jgi:hypothetical protein
MQDALDTVLKTAFTREMRWFETDSNEGSCLLEVGQVEAFGEPVVNFGKQTARLVAAAGVMQEPLRVMTYANQ